MTFDLWWLLIVPALFAAGWVAARLDARQLQREQTSLPRSYFKGLNFLLNEQPDQAIDAFVEVARLDPETVDLHFALGNLFRRRGETERAIRVHQNLVNRPDLPATERDHAVFELGQDFLKAGMLDRAEQTLALLTDGPFVTPARRALLEICEIEKEWAQAIDAAMALRATGAAGAADLAPQIAHYHCELAQQQLQRSDLAGAALQLDAAHAIYPRSVRATLLQADLAVAQQRIDDAIAAWRQIEVQDPAYLSLAAPKLVGALVDAGRGGEALDWLRERLARDGGELLDLAYQQVRTQQGPEAALALVEQALQQHPSLAGLAKLFDAQAALAADADKPRLEALRNLVGQRTKNLARYTCRHCGFRARLFYWQCPGCNGWDTYAPKRAETLGATASPSM